jgi:hypothetical protein
MLERIEVDTLSDIAVADGFDIFLGVLGVHGILLCNRLILRSLGLRGLRRRRLRRDGLRGRLCLRLVRSLSGL